MHYLYAVTTTTVCVTKFTDNGSSMYTLCGGAQRAPLWFNTTVRRAREGAVTFNDERIAPPSPRIRLCLSCKERLIAAPVRMPKHHLIAFNMCRMSKGLEAIALGRAFY